MTEKMVLTPYDITGKSEIEVRCTVYDRLLTLIQTKEQTEDETLKIAGKDTLFDIVAGAYLKHVNAIRNKDTSPVSVPAYIEEKVHKLFAEKGDNE